MAFELSAIEATLRSVTPRTEKHGDDDVFAVSLGFKITTANTILDRLNATLRTSLYMAVPDQEQLPGIEPSTPLLRTRAIETLTLGASFDGWTLTIPHGIDEDDPIKLGSCKVDKFKVGPKEGGSVELFFRVGSNDINATEAGMLCAKLGQSVEIALTAPVLQTAPLIDGTVGHPGLAAQKKADENQIDLLGDGDATEIFSRQHGGDETGAPGAGDSDSAGEPQRGDGWPFPGGDAGGEAGGDGGDAAAAESAGPVAAAKPAARGKGKTKAHIE